MAETEEFSGQVCDTCSQHFRYLAQIEKNLRLKYWNKLTKEEAETFIKGSLQSIEDVYAFLQAQCEAKGDTIVDRWQAKNPQQREACLLMADPHLPQSRRPLLDYITVPGRRFNTPEGFNVWLLPWLNTKILMNDPMMFLRLLWTRTNYSPEQWTSYDNLQLRHAWETGSLPTGFCLQCIVVHGSRYGDLVEMEEDAIHRGDVIGFPRAQLVFEAQERLLSLLKRVVEQLLQETGTKVLGSFEKWSQLALKDPGMSKTLDFCSPDVYQPFLAPPEFSIDHLLSVAQTRLKEAEDHIWLLQTDPYYMQHSLNINRSGAMDKLAKSTTAACVPLSI